MALSKKLIAAYAVHRKADDRVRVAEKRVEDFLRHLFTALKDREAAWIKQRETGTRLRKIRGF